MEVTTAKPSPRTVLWCAYVLCLIASLTHVQGAFSGLERAGWLGQIVAFIAAASVDVGLATLPYVAGQRKRDGLNPWPYMLGVVLFALVSAFANLDHGLRVLALPGPVAETVAATWERLVLWDKARVVVLSVALPILTVYLAWAVESLGELAVVATQTVPTGQADALREWVLSQAEAPHWEDAAKQFGGVSKATVDRWRKAAGLQWRAGRLVA